MSTDTPQRTRKRATQEPADLQLYHKSTEKRGRAAISQTPDTPAKAETKADTAKNLGLKQAKEADRPESPLLELSDGEELFADTDASIEIAQATRIKVLQHELHHIKQEVMMSKQAAAQAQAEKGQLDAEAQQLRKQLHQLTGSNIENCDEDELHEIGKLLDRAQGRVAVERTRQSTGRQQANRQSASKLNRRLDW